LCKARFPFISRNLMEFEVGNRRKRGKFWPITGFH
jgi:hypothetical protein